MKGISGDRIQPILSRPYLFASILTVAVIAVLLLWGLGGGAYILADNPIR